MRLRCKSKLQAQDAFVRRLRRLSLARPTVSYLPWISVVRARNQYLKGFEVCFALRHDVAEIQSALSPVMKLSKDLSNDA